MEEVEEVELSGAPQGPKRLKCRKSSLRTSHCNVNVLQMPIQMQVRGTPSKTSTGLLVLHQLGPLAISLDR